MTTKLPLFASAFVSACALAAITAAPAAAGHRPHHHHGHHAHKHHAKHCMKRVAHKLHHMGFVSWDEIEWDDGYWEVDDARRADGSQYDLKLSPHGKVVHSKKER